jgi:hypothetical protein
MPIVPKNPMPERPADWLVEIARAYCHAQATAPELHSDLTPHELFLFGPEMCLKFRGVRQAEKLLQNVTAAAMDSHLESPVKTEANYETAELDFAHTYVASHLGLGLVDAKAVAGIMDYVKKNRHELFRLVEGTGNAGSEPRL